MTFDSCLAHARSHNTSAIVGVSQSTGSVTRTPPSHTSTKRMRRKLPKLFRKLYSDRIREFVSGNIEMFLAWGMAVERSIHKSSCSFETRFHRAKVYFSFQRKRKNTALNKHHRPESMHKDEHSFFAPAEVALNIADCVIH